MKAKLYVRQAAAVGKRVWMVAGRHAGLPLVYLGVFLFALFYVAGLTDHNLLLALPLFLVVAGTVGYVHRQKAAGEY